MWSHLPATYLGVYFRTMDALERLGLPQFRYQFARWIVADVED